MLTGHATTEGTGAYVARLQAGLAPDFFSTAGDLRVSSIGLGTYLGDESAATDRSYEEAIATALELGVNHLDTAVNYRGMASERAVGRALAAAAARGVPRDAILVATKGGYVPHDAHAPGSGGRALVEALIREKKIEREELAKGSHCLAPRFLEAMLATSLANLGLSTIDVYYLHNPEAQLSAGVPRQVFYARCRAAFEVLEAARRAGQVRAYGTATWNGYRRPPGAPDALELERLVAEARAAAGGDAHGLRWVQLPVNLAMTEALARPTQSVRGETVTLVEAARRLGVLVVASGSIAQAELALGLPEKARSLAWPVGVATNASRALHAVRSAPGITTALVGMSRAAHVRENLASARVPKLGPDAVRSLVERGGGSNRAGPTLLA